MDQVRKQKIADAIALAQSNEQVMHKDAAAIFGCSPLVFTYLKKEKYWGNIGRDVWAQLEKWMFSGKKLKDYPKADDVQDEEQAQSTVPSRIELLTKDIKPMFLSQVKPSANALIAAAKEKAHQMRDEARETRKQKGKDKPAPDPKPQKEVEAQIAVVVPEKKDKVVSKSGDIIAKLAFEIEILIKLK
jgi:hypothetical protein